MQAEQVSTALASLANYSLEEAIPKVGELGFLSIGFLCVGGARHSIGLGANGVGIGVAFFLYKVAIENHPVNVDLLWSAALVALGTGIALELLNYVALAKRQAIRRITSDLDDARAESRALQQKIREASRV